MKRKPTEAQKAKAKERREEMRKLAKVVSEMTPAQRMQLAAEFPVTTIEGHTLSVFNHCFVLSQRSNCTIVGGFGQWKKAGRFVRKGETGMALWIPIKGKADDNEEQPDELRFILGTVFDISQTEEMQVEEKEAA